MISVASKSLGSTTVMRIVLVLVSSAGGGSEVTGRSGVGSCGWVERAFFWASFAWRFSVARLFGRCFSISSAVRPVHEDKFPLLIAVIKVLGTGQKAER